MPKFLRQFLLFTAALGLPIYALSRVYGAAVVHPRTGLIFVVMAALTYFAYSLTARLVARDPNSLAMGYLIGMTARLLVSLGLVTWLLAGGIAKDPRGVWTFLGAFFILYFSWAGFEIWATLSNLRPISEKQVTQ